MDFSEDQLRRYARQIVMPEIGGIGQQKLMRAKVLVIGAGGLGSPLLLYLAAAGIGRIGIVDHDIVDVSNLHRQIIHSDAGAGEAKVMSAVERLRGLNPDIDVVVHPVKIDASNAAFLISAYDLVADGTDNFATRDVVHEACYRQGRTLVSAAIQGVDGQLSTFKAHLGAPHPCYRCLFPQAPATDVIPTCAQGGVLGPAVGALGSMQAVEVIKEVLGIGESLSGSLVLYDALAAQLHRVRVARDPACPLCSQASAP
ncbi:MAG: ThiF family adenylyltransferase [Geminicoccaceae bacterium]